MNIRYVAQDLDWSQRMMEEVKENVAIPLAEDLNTANFELFMHLKVENGRSGREPKYEMWAVLQTSDGRCNEVIRRKGGEFQNLLNEVSAGMRASVRRKRAMLKASWLKAFRLWDFEPETAALKQYACP